MSTKGLPGPHRWRAGTETFGASWKGAAYQNGPWRRTVQVRMNLINELGGWPLDTDTFLTLLYVLIDDFFQHEGPPEARRAGPRPALNRSEVLCLALFARTGVKMDRFYRFKNGLPSRRFGTRFAATYAWRCGSCRLR